jgi:hypothetical protein
LKPKRPKPKNFDRYYPSKKEWQKAMNKKSMKKLKLIIGVAALLLATVSMQAQTLTETNESGGLTTILNSLASKFPPLQMVVLTTNVVQGANGSFITNYTISVGNGTLPYAPVPSTPGDLIGAWGKAIIDSTNMAVAGFYGRKLTGQGSVAGALVSYSLFQNMALIAGAEHLWGASGTNTAQNFTLSGGISLNASFDVYTNKSFRITLNPFGMSLVGSPLNGANSGNLMNVNRIGADIDLLPIGGTGWELCLGGAYGNRTGDGSYNGNYGDVFLAAKHKFNYLGIGTVSAQVGINP